MGNFYDQAVQKKDEMGKFSLKRAKMATLVQVRMHISRFEGREFYGE